MENGADSRPNGNWHYADSDEAAGQELVEELIRAEGEELAAGIFEEDYCSLTERHRHLLRFAAVEHLGLNNWWRGGQVIRER